MLWNSYGMLRLIFTVISIILFQLLVSLLFFSHSSILSYYFECWFPWILVVLKGKASPSKRISPECVLRSERFAVETLRDAAVRRRVESLKFFGVGSTTGLRYYEHLVTKLDNFGFRSDLITTKRRRKKFLQGTVADVFPEFLRFQRRSNY